MDSFLADEFAVVGAVIGVVAAVAVLAVVWVVSGFVERALPRDG